MTKKSAAEMLLFMTGNRDTVTTFGDYIDASHIAFVFPAALFLHFILDSSILGKSSMNMIAAGRLRVTGKPLTSADILQVLSEKAPVIFPFQTGQIKVRF